MDKIDQIRQDLVDHTDRVDENCRTRFGMSWEETKNEFLQMAQTAVELSFRNQYEFVQSRYLYYLGHGKAGGLNHFMLNRLLMCLALQSWLVKDMPIPKAGHPDLRIDVSEEDESRVRELLEDVGLRTDKEELSESSWY